MRKVLIVDDEAIIRIALKTIIPWGEYGFSLAEAVGNGQEALAAIEAEQPDIVITDLKMPIMDGLTLLQQLKERHFKGKVIVLSNYGEFDMVRSAMKLGAFDYMLKVTVQREELLELLQRAVEQLTTERSELEEQVKIKTEWMENRLIRRNQLYREVWSGSIDEEQLSREANELEIPLAYKNCFLLFVQMNGINEAMLEGQIKDRQLLSLSVQNIVSDAVRDRANVEFIQINDKQHILKISGNDSYTLKEKQIGLAEYLVSMLRMYLNLKVIIAVGGTMRSIFEMKIAYDYALYALQLSFYDTQASVFHKDQVQFSNKPLLDAFTSIKKQLQQAIDQNDTSTLLDMVSGVVDESVSIRTAPEYVKEFGSLLIQELEFRLIDWGALKSGDKLFKARETKLTLCESIEVWRQLLREIIDEAFLLLSGYKSQTYRSEVVIVMEFINRNLDRKISLGDVAKEVNMNESYLSRIFRQETGSTIVEYINEQKMERARALLKNPNLSIKEVSNEVGISDPFYFNRLFKKSFGESPTSFKQKVSGKG